MEYISMSGGGGEGFAIEDLTESWVYILGAVLGMFFLMAMFIKWQSS